MKLRIVEENIKNLISKNENNSTIVEIDDKNNANNNNKKKIAIKIPS